MNQTAAECRHRIDTPQEIDSSQRRWAWLSTGSLALALMEAACIFFVGASGAGAFLGSGALLVVRHLLPHSAPVRLPLLAIATAVALLNLWLLWNRWRLRQAPAARWRKKPLSRGERLRTGFILIASLLTLLVVGTELYLHHELHGSAFAKNAQSSLARRA